MKLLFLILTAFALAACAVPVDAPPPPTALPSATPPPAVTSPSTVVASPSPVSGFCADPRGTELIVYLREAIQTKDGKLLASLISPTLGMDVRFLRDGNVINYDVEHAQFVFETTYQADWGLHFASGEPVIGSFQEIILPSLQGIFSADTEIVCNELTTGGATYIPEWQYPDMDFYSVHFPGTEQYSGLDWQTWVVGMTPVDDTLYITALSHFVWEP